MVYRAFYCCKRLANSSSKVATFWFSGIYVKSIMVLFSYPNLAFSSPSSRQYPLHSPLFQGVLRNSL